MMPDTCKLNSCNPVTITLKAPKHTDNGTYVLGAWVSGTNPVGIFHITVSANLINKTTSIMATPTTPTMKNNPVKYIDVKKHKGNVCPRNGIHRFKCMVIMDLSGLRQKRGLRCR